MQQQTFLYRRPRVSSVQFRRSLLPGFGLGIVQASLTRRHDAQEAGVAEEEPRARQRR